MFYQVTCTYDGFSAKIYVNGVLDVDVIPEYNGPLKETDIPVIFGKKYNNDSASAAFDGSIKKARIWNKTLDINSLDNHDDFLIADWSYSSGSGDILYDHSGNQNHGIIHGATWVENIYGCTDELACNFSPTANISDDSCDYSCHENGDYSLSFDGLDDYIEIFYNSSFSQLNEFTLSSTYFT